jgi:hypothetical protein
MYGKWLATISNGLWQYPAKIWVQDLSSIDHLQHYDKVDFKILTILNLKRFCFCKTIQIQFTLEKATKAQRGDEVQLYSFFKLAR